MNDKTYMLNLAEVQIPCQFLYEETVDRFGEYVEETKTDLDVVRLDTETLDKYRRAFPENAKEDLIEFSVLTARISDELLGFRRVLFHGLAFVWREKAYIFTAPSGTGKTTQYVLWKKCFGEEIAILNGDKIVLEVTDDSTIMVHSSPWKGKEHMGKKMKVELGGIIYLQQGKENVISKMKKKDTVLPLFRQVFFMSKKKDHINKVLELLEQLIENVPIWLLINRGDEEAVRITRKELEEYQEKVETIGG